jgi:hypothetical protein
MSKEFEIWNHVFECDAFVLDATSLSLCEVRLIFLLAVRLDKKNPLIARGSMFTMDLALFSASFRLFLVILRLSSSLTDNNSPINDLLYFFVSTSQILSLFFFFIIIFFKKINEFSDQ